LGSTITKSGNSLPVDRQLTGLGFWGLNSTYLKPIREGDTEKLYVFFDLINKGRLDPIVKIIEEKQFYQIVDENLSSEVTRREYLDSTTREPL